MHGKESITAPPQTKLTPPKNTFFIETYGCQMNEYDSLIAQNIMEKNQAQKVEAIEDAGLIILNTCAIRENAHTKIYNRVRSLEHLHKKGAKIGIIGCMAQNLKQDLLYENLPIDFIMGPDSLRNLSSLFQNQSPENESKAFVDLSRTEMYDDLVPTVEHHLNANNNTTSAFISIQRGCNNFCTFCVVPYTRGRERSRSVASIIDEIKKLQETSIRSVILLGQNVNSYQNQQHNFTHLIENILRQTSIERIYFTSPHPKDFPEELIDLMAAEKRFCSQVHLPLQAGSNEVLKRMKRNYSKESYLDLVAKFRAKVDDVAISTDVIVGFPGETTGQFEETLAVMEAANFDSAFMFAYSERRSTLAKKMYPDDISAEEKQRRLSLMIDQQMQRSLMNNQKYIGSQVEVMIENQARRGEGQLSGRMLNGRKVLFTLGTVTSENNSAALFGRSIMVKIQAASKISLFGEANGADFIS